MRDIDKIITSYKGVAKEVKDELARDILSDGFDNEAHALEFAEEVEQIAEWLTELQERREADRWIPVTERLPNTLGVYNVTRKIIEGETSYVISDACYFDGQNTWHADTGINHGRPYITDVIAWKPLPKPYKESEAENEANN